MATPTSAGCAASEPSPTDCGSAREGCFDNYECYEETSSATGITQSSSRSWAEMAEEGSTLDMDELPELDVDP